MQHFTTFFPKFKSNLMVKRVFLLLNAVFAVAIVYLISRVHFAQFVVVLPKYRYMFYIKGT